MMRLHLNSSVQRSLSILRSLPSARNVFPFKSLCSISESQSNIITNSEHTRARNKCTLTHVLASIKRACLCVELHLRVFIFAKEDV